MISAGSLSTLESPEEECDESDEESSPEEWQIDAFDPREVLESCRLKLLELRRDDVLDLLDVFDDLK